MFNSENARKTISKLFEEDFKNLIKTKGRNINEHYVRIRKVLFKFYDLEKKSDLDLKQFENILNLSTNLLKQIHTIKFKEGFEGDVASRTSNLIFLAIGTIAKLTDYSNEVNSFIKRHCNSFSRFYDLMRLSIISSKMIKEKNEFTDNEYSHLENIEYDINNLIKIFSNEFINSINNKAFNEQNDFELYIDWHLDIYYLKKLKNVLESIKVVGNPTSGVIGGKLGSLNKLVSDNKLLFINNMTLINKAFILIHETFDNHISYWIKELLIDESIEPKYKYTINLIKSFGPCLKTFLNDFFYYLDLTVTQRKEDFLCLLKYDICQEVSKEIEDFERFQNWNDEFKKASNSINKLNFITENVKSARHRLLSLKKESTNKLEKIIKSDTYYKPEGEKSISEYLKCKMKNFTRDLRDEKSIKEFSIQEHIETIAIIIKRISQEIQNLELDTLIDSINNKQQIRLIDSNTEPLIKFKLKRILQLRQEYYIESFCVLISHYLLEIKNTYRYEYLNQTFTKLTKHINWGKEFFIYNYSQLVNEITIIEEIISDNLNRSSANIEQANEKFNPYYIELEEHYKALTQGFKWEVSELSIIIGKNGIGKTSLIEYLKENYNFQIAISANHLQEIEDAFENTMNNINKNQPEINSNNSKKIQTREICHYINDYGAFLLPDDDKVGKKRFPIIELLFAQFHEKSNIYGGTSRIKLILKEGEFSVRKELRSIFEKYKLDFVLQDLHKDDNDKFQLFFIKNDSQISFSDLSSGEKVLFTLISCAVVNKLIKSVLGSELPKLLLFDEVDIHFHPEYTKIFFEIIKDYFTNNDTYTVMSTHNPATISLSVICDNAKIFVMQQDKDFKTVIESAISKRNAISILSNRMLTIVKDCKYVVVEAKDDVKFYNIIYQKFLASSHLSLKHTQLIFASAGLEFTVDQRYKDDIEKLNEGFDEVLNEIKKLEIDKFKDLGKAISNSKNQINALKKFGSEEFFAGCDQIKPKVRINQYEGNYDKEGKVTIGGNLKKIPLEHISEIIWGLTDRDNGQKRKISDGTMRALKDVYSIENYLCMPYNLAFLITKRDPETTRIFKEYKIVNAKLPLAQIISNYVLEYLKNQMLKNMKIKIVETFEGFTGHERLQNVQLRDELIDKVHKFCAINISEIYKKHNKLNPLKQKLINQLKEYPNDFKDIANKMLSYIASNIRKVCEKFTFPKVDYSQYTILSSDPNLVLANDQIIQYPIVFFEERGHDLLKSINFCLNIPGEDNRPHIEILEKIPSRLLPKSLLSTMEDLVLSRT